MAHPWREIDLQDYEAHMRQESVRQLQVVNAMMRAQLAAYPARRIMVLGVAGGNGLEHIPAGAEAVYGVDLNAAYLRACEERHPALAGVFRPLCLDLVEEAEKLPEAELIVANIMLEYIGYAAFQAVVRQARPRWVTAAIQVNAGEEFVSTSPYAHVFDRLEEILHDVSEEGAAAAMEAIGYRQTARFETPLPNGKRFVRLDFERAAEA